MRLFKMLVSFVRGMDVQNVSGLCSAKNKEEAVGRYLGEVAGRYPGYAITGNIEASDVTDLVRRWVAQNPAS